MMANYTSTSREPYEFDEDCCIKCHDPESKNENLATVTTGLDKLIQYSDFLQDDQLKLFLVKRRSTNGVVKIHRACQKAIHNDLKRKGTRPRTKLAKIPKVVTRSNVTDFDWIENCLYCTEKCIDQSKHPDRSKFRKVCTLPFKDSILKVCTERDDEWAADVKRRVLDCHDLVAAEARYHTTCIERFSLKVNKTRSNLTSPGRPVSSSGQKHFDAVCEWLETEAEVYSLSEIHRKMIELAGLNDDVYSKSWLETKLIAKYGEHIVFVKAAGKSSVVCFKGMAEFLVNDKWFVNRKLDTDDEAKRIILTASKLILDNIRSAKFNCEQYPTREEIESCEKGIEWLPEYVKLFLDNIIKYPLKQASIGQAIVHATRPRSCIPPILFGLGVEADHVVGSKWLVSELTRLGFSLSVDEVTRFKQSVTENENATDIISTYMPGSFSQWSADNVDHNVRTLDGKDTLHAMGIVCSTTNKDGPTHLANMRPVPRQKIQKVGSLIKNKGISVTLYVPPEESGLSKLFFKDLSNLKIHLAKTREHDDYNLIWNASIFFRECERPGWSGFMSNVSTGNYPGPSTVSLLPIIDLNPSDLSCIYSTLNFVIDQAEQLNMETPVLTFDQPLWLKATEIVSAKSLKVVLVLGGFHLMMSYLGSIGTLMKGSGLSEALQTSYGRNAVEHMMSGKAVSRALRGHFLASSALTTKLLKPIFPTNYVNQAVPQAEDDIHSAEAQFETDGNDSDDDTDLPESNLKHGGDGSAVTDIPLTIDEVNTLETLYKKMEEGSEDAAEHLARSVELRKLGEQYQLRIESLAQSSRTAKFWIQYQNYVDILKLFIRAERTGNWELHLVALSKMINLFAATGHINYAKSARLHLQNMLELETNYPWVSTNFAKHGYHTVRRSDRYWAGLWSDLIIEQVLMRALKSRGGLTRGRGVTESARLLWVKSMHRCADVHNAMCSLTGLQHQSSEQHVELGISRVKRDNSDLQKLVAWFDIHDPFQPNEPLLRSLSSGLAAKETDKVNCDDAEQVGQNIQASLNGVCVENCKIKRNDQIRTLEHLRPGVKIGEKTIHIDPLILFTRLAAIVHRESDPIEQFNYELTPEPSSLFKDGLMRKPNKATLRNTLLVKVEPSKDVAAKSCVIDGGALLHKVKWFPDSTFGDVLKLYVNYVERKCVRFEHVSVVFDGYSDILSTKAEEHSRRAGVVSADVIIEEATVVTVTREAFLRNSTNKVQFITRLTRLLQEKGIATVQSSGDADVLIVKGAVDYATENEVVVFADDTDILILLMHHWNSYMRDIYFSIEKLEGARRVQRQWNIRSVVESQPHADHILFAHAWGGCDTTSATYRRGKCHFYHFVAM